MGEGERWRFIFFYKSFIFLLHLKTNILKTTCHIKNNNNNNSTFGRLNQNYSDYLILVCSYCKFMSFENSLAVLRPKTFVSSYPEVKLSHILQPYLENNIIYFFLFTHVTLVQSTIIFHLDYCYRHLFHLFASVLASVKYILNSKARMILFKQKPIPDTLY